MIVLVKMNTKQRMIEAAAESLRRNGLAGTSFSDVLEVSGAARGAIYHHFPAGKAELVDAAVRQTGTRVTTALHDMPAQKTQADVVNAFLQLVRPVVADSAAGAGCAVAAVATETPPGSPLMIASAEALASWRNALAEQFELAGTPTRKAGELAALLIATLEGAHVLCRAEGSIALFDAAARALRALAA